MNDNSIEIKINKHLSINHILIYLLFRLMNLLSYIKLSILEI
jgi:hypothetical protein